MAATAPASRTVVLTARDRELLAFAAEQRFVLAAQIGRLLGISAEAAGGRLRALRSGGYLRSERRLTSAPTAFRVTRAGAGAAGCELTPPKELDLATYAHEVGVGWLAIAAHRGSFGALTDVIGERRMRSQDARRDRPADRPTHGVRLGAGERGRPRLHYPDLTVVTATGHRIALELELSTKEAARRERILSAYAADRSIDAVVYLVDSRAAGEAIERSAARVGATGLVRVQRFRWSEGRRPDASPAPARRRDATAARRSGAVAEGGAVARTATEGCAVPRTATEGAAR